MRIAILTNEYPPNVYGGAGVHVEYLTRGLARLDGGRHRIRVLCFGEQRSDEGNLSVEGIAPDATLRFQDPRHEKFFDTLARDLLMAGTLDAADIVHCHTWYTHLAGCLAKQLTEAKLILTTHSLEPHRPWKVEQLGTAYQASTWIEETAYRNADGVIAVSDSMRHDVQALYGVPDSRIRVIPNGIDLEQYRPARDLRVLAKYGINPESPYLLFVGRITRQKGIIHLVQAIKHLDQGVQVVLCAGEADTPEIELEMAARIDEARRVARNHIVWIDQIVSKQEIIALNSQAALFVCPSVYEPFGIINLEAMACGTPVVASAVGGIPEVVEDGETGRLVSFEPVGNGNFEPKNPVRFAADLAVAINSLLADPNELQRLRRNARRRVEQHFGWDRIAARTLKFYEAVLGRR